jgi:hypothetical protein
MIDLFGQDFRNVAGPSSIGYEKSLHKIKNQYAEGGKGNDGKQKNKRHRQRQRNTVILDELVYRGHQ